MCIRDSLGTEHVEFDKSERLALGDVPRHLRPPSVAAIEDGADPFSGAGLVVEDRVDLVEEDRRMVAVDLAKEDRLRRSGDPPGVADEELEHVQELRLAALLDGRGHCEDRRLLEAFERDVSVGDPQCDRLSVRYEWDIPIEDGIADAPAW